jgi:hypothetical protein
MLVMRPTEKTAERIPPPGEPLQFARNAKTGRVHIMRWCPRDERAPFAEIVLSTHTRELCGVDLWDAQYVAGDGFADDDLCSACVRVLGDQQWRAFHVDSRGAS